MTAAEAGTDWYAERAKGWAARQRAEDEKWRIPEGGLFVKPLRAVDRRRWPALRPGDRAPRPVRAPRGQRG
ncbi:hypothetical protein [Streptomyces avermitilis]|uniref:hypothetical protein n=1 Tax=Streptomyces avermitilis TaxID=33903 RepID=UPI003824B74F